MFKIIFKKRKGMSIVELLVAILIFLIAVLFVVELFPQSFRMSKYSKVQTITALLAKQKMEEVLYLPDTFFPVPIGQTVEIPVKDPVNSNANWTGFFTDSFLPIQSYWYEVTAKRYDDNTNFVQVKVNVVGPYNFQSAYYILKNSTQTGIQIASNYCATVCWIPMFNDKVRRLEIDNNGNKVSDTTLNVADSASNKAAQTSAVATDSGEGKIAWISDAQGKQIFYYNGTSFTRVYNATNLNNQTPSAIACDASGSIIWIATKDQFNVDSKGGLYYCNTNSGSTALTSIDTTGHEFYNPVSLFFDASGAFLWIADGGNTKGKTSKILSYNKTSQAWNTSLSKQNLNTYSLFTNAESDSARTLDNIRNIWSITNGSINSTPLIASNSYTSPAMPVSISGSYDMNAMWCLDYMNTTFTLYYYTNNWMPKTW